MEKRLTVADYLGMPETNKPQELVYGILREPPAPFYGHQAVVTRVAAVVGDFVRRTKAGAVCVSPVCVSLVLQPDVIFVAASRMHIISDRVWGPPDLVVEVLSPGTARRDRTRKLDWYRAYGVRECWLVDAGACEVTVIRLDRSNAPRRRSYRGNERIYSRVLAGFRPSARRLTTA